MRMTNQVVNHALTPNMIQIKNKFNEPQTSFWKVYRRKYVGAQFVPRWSLVNVQIIYSQVVRQGEAMPTLEWTRGHEWSINVSRKGDHHCLTWARNSRKKWHFFYKNLKARVKSLKAKLFLNVAKALWTNDMKPTLLKTMWKKRWWWASSSIGDCQKRTGLEDVQRLVTRKGQMRIAEAIIGKFTITWLIATHLTTSKWWFNIEYFHNLLGIFWEKD